MNNNETNKSKKQEIIDYLKNLDDSFSITGGDDYSNKIKEKEFDNRSLDDIKNEATELLQSYKNTNLDTITNDYENQKVELSKNVENETKNANDLKSKLNSSIENAKQNVSDDVLKRGLARSSIAINQISNLENQKVDKLADIDKETNANINKINSQIELLEAQKQNALSNFDITYAVKLAEKISDLNSEVAKYNEEVLEYNNKLNQQEREYKDDRAETNREIYEYLDLNGGKALQSKLTESKKNYLNEYFDSLSKNEALGLLGDAEIKNKLGEFYNEIFLKILDREN